MAVKQKFSKLEERMPEFKNLKVPERTHETLDLRAEALGLKLYVLADALLRTGLALSDREIQDAVVNARQPKLKQQSTDTNPAPTPVQQKPPASSAE